MATQSDPDGSLGRLARDGLQSSVAGAVLFGAVGLPLMVVLGWLWSQHDSPCDGMGCLGAAAVVALAGGVCFWYLAGLGWEFPEGLLLATMGIGAGWAVPLFGWLVLGQEVMTVFVYGWVVAGIGGVVAYPFGSLVRLLPRKGGLAWLGLAWGGVLVMLGLAGFVIPPPRDDPISLVADLAPLTLMAGIGTVAIVTRPLVRRDFRTS